MPKLFFMWQGSFVLPAQPSTKRFPACAEKVIYAGTYTEDLSLLHEFQVSLG